MVFLRDQSQFTIIAPFLVLWRNSASRRQNHQVGNWQGLLNDLPTHWVYFFSSFFGFVFLFSYFFDVLGSGSGYIPSCYDFTLRLTAARSSWLAPMVCLLSATPMFSGIPGIYLKLYLANTICDEVP